MINKFFFSTISALLITLFANAHTNFSTNCPIDSLVSNVEITITSQTWDGGVVVIEHGKAYGDEREIFVHCVYKKDLQVIIVKADKKTPRYFDKHIRKRKFKKTWLKRGRWYKWIAYDESGEVSQDEFKIR